MSTESTYSLSENTEDFNLLNEPSATYGPTRIAIIRRGVSFNSLNHFIKKTGLTRVELSSILQVSTRTLQRIDDRIPLSSSITEKLFQLNDLYNLAKDSLGPAAENITAWLREKNTALGSEKPLDLLDTYIGFQEVQNILGRMSHGVYS